MNKSASRYSRYILAGIASTLLLLLLYIAPFSESEHKLASKKISYTPEELRQLEIQKKKERRKTGYSKFAGPDKFAQFHHAIRTKAGAADPDYAFNYKLTELEKAWNNPLLHQRRVSAMDWVERGPANVSGRTRALVNLDELTNNTWLAGSVGGGVWKTTTGGSNWQLLTPNFPNLATSTLGVSPANPDIIYAGTGEGFFNIDAVNGDGLFKSIDGGVSWTQLASTVSNIDFQNVNRIIVDPGNPEILLACTNNGRYTASYSVIMRSEDGGENWTKVYESVRKIQQLIFAPDDFSIQYAAVNGVGVIKSTDAGLTWQDVSEGLSPAGRIELAISPQDPQRIYAAAEGNLSSPGSDLYITVDGGDSWKLVVEANDGANHNWLGGQGWYNNALAVHPFNKNVVYAGGIDLWKMEIIEPSGSPVFYPSGAETENAGSFLDFVDFGGLFLNGGITTGEDWYADYPEYPLNVNANDYVAVEIRFGPGISQKAHRFTVPEGEGAGVPPTGYTYQDYITVPFQVWDVANNVQLMVSFRDQERDGAFNLESQDPADPAQSREYIFIHALTYNPSAPHSSVAKSAGMAYKNIYALWPTLLSGASWNPGGLPDSKIMINTVERVLRETTNISDAYQQYAGSNSNVHVDHHVILPIITDESGQIFKLLNANDGGVYVSSPSTDPGVTDGSWSHVSSGYNTTQFYGVDKKRGADEYLGGMQDNGSWRSPLGVTASASTEYLFQISGDGFDVVWNYADPNKLIGSAQYNKFFRSTDGGNLWQLATSGLADNDEQTAPFISKIENVKTNPDVLFAVGKTGVWRSDNFGGSWNSTPISDSWSFGSFTDVKISLANNQIVWAGGEISLNGRLHVSTNGGLTFSKTNNYEEEVMGVISGLATHPYQDSTAYALFSFARSPKILRTTNLGASWHDITGFEGFEESKNGFPDVAVYSFFVFPNEPNRLWAGTEIGLVESLDNGQSWALANNGLPSAAIWDIKLVDNQIVVATHGRGIWTVEIPVDVDVFFAPYISATGITPKGELALAVSLRSEYDSIKILIDDIPYLKRTEITVADTVFKLFNLPPNDSVTIAIDAYFNNKKFRSNYAHEFIFPIDEYLASYTTDFEEIEIIADDFVGDGFGIKMEPNFTDLALHSEHEYQRNREYKVILAKSFIIAGENASFSYEDIALVEPGEDGHFYGDEKLYDYVIVEGTLDGLNWTPILPGYDARHNENWLLAYNNKENGREELFVKHSVNLLNNFSPNDTVLFRFRLFSDPGEVHWGWAIDNLAIQSGEPLQSVDYMNEHFFIRCSPNPVSGTASLSYSLPHPSPAKIQVLNVAGQQVEEYSLPLFELKGDFEWTPPRKNGLYIIRIQTSYGVRSTKALVRN